MTVTRQGRTALMISRRLGVARLAERVIVLRDGVIVEEGHHDRLVAQDGVSAALFAGQAQWYRWEDVGRELPPHTPTRSSLSVPLCSRTSTGSPQQGMSCASAWTGVSQGLP